MKRLIAEFEAQSYTQIIFPHKDTDWVCCLKEAQNNFKNIINAIIKYQKCVVICDDVNEVKQHFAEDENLIFKHYKTDDAWARDCSALSIENEGKLELLDFTFNGWGAKFEASRDNAMTQYLNPNAIACDFILEGGGIESNGLDTLLMSSHTMFNKNRNKEFSEEEITLKLQKYFGAKQILYLHHGYLAGDDTDSHIDTLARFIDKETIMYVQCKDEEDEHYQELKLMEEELSEFSKFYGLSLIALPMCSAIYDDKERLPATYANFLFVNGAVLVPIYNVVEDDEALRIFQQTFQDRDIVPINCATLIKQHGSLHCVTMNFRI